MKVRECIIHAQLGTLWVQFLARCLSGSILVPRSLMKEGHAPCYRPGLAVLQPCLLPDDALAFRQRSQGLVGSDRLNRFLGGAEDRDHFSCRAVY